MKKILISLVMVLALGLIVTKATASYFSDTETATDNTFTAGTLDLKTDNHDGVTAKFTLADLKPGDSYRQIGVAEINLKNAGSVPGHLWYEYTNVRNYENVCTEPEVGDSTCGGGSDQGELGQYVKPFLQLNQPPYGSNYQPSLVTINSAVGNHYDMQDLAPGQSIAVVMRENWNPTATDNLAQGDSTMFDIVFHLDQTP